MNRTIAGLLLGLLSVSRAGAQVLIESAEPLGQSRVAADAEKLEAAADQIARMKTAMKQVLARVEEARNEKDVVKLNCVNEKLTQIKALLKVAEQADVALHEAVSNRDPSSDTEFSKIAIARSKVEGLRGESEQCIGQLAYMVDEKTTVEVEQPSDLPGAGPGESGLGLARRGANPADVVAQIGTGDATPAGAIGLGTGGTLGGGGAGSPTSGWAVPPPAAQPGPPSSPLIPIEVIVPPAASPSE